MASRDWFRVLQVPMLPVGAGPVVVGSLFGAIPGRLPLDAPVFALALSSVLLIQAGANVQKGVVESADLPTAPARPRSVFVFDAGAVRRVGLDDRKLRALVGALFGAGAVCGLAVVWIRWDTTLLLLGILGFIAAYSYSGPPFKLSYYGLGEISTFLAFGPLMFVGAYYSQAGSLPANAVQFVLNPLSVAFGCLASAVSFARYFPQATEDKEKGKRTPVVLLGPKASLVPMVVLLLLPALVFLLFSGQGSLSLIAVAPSAVIVGFGVPALALLASSTRSRVEAGVGATVLLHFVFSLVLTIFAYQALLAPPPVA